MDRHMASSIVDGFNGERLVVLEKKYEQLEIQAGALNVQVLKLELQ